jgi:hypothetical protein
MTDLRLACTAVDVTPPPGSALAGYGARGNAISQGVHDPLEATLVWLQDTGSGTDVVWIALDVVGVDGDLAAAVSTAVAGAIGRPDAVVLVCASHTHSAAATWFRRPLAGLELFGPDGDEEPRRRLVALIAEAAGRLPAGLRPVNLQFAQAPVSGVGANRHRAEGPHDSSAGVLTAVDEEGRVVAVLTDYGNHPTVLGHENLLWSADWPGAARRALSGALSALTPFDGGTAAAEAAEAAAVPPVVLFLQGAAGDSSARFVRRSQTFAEADRLGGLYAAQVQRALLEGSGPVEGPVRVRRSTVTLATRSSGPLPVAQEREAAARAEWEAVRRTGAEGSPEERIARTRHEGTLASLRMAELGLPPSMQLPMSVVAVGEHAWVHLPVELFASYGLRIREASPFATTRIVGYTDGYFGYVPDADARAAGAYEAGVGLFDTDACEQLCRAAIELVRETAEVPA